MDDQGCLISLLRNWEEDVLQGLSLWLTCNKNPNNIKTQTTLVVN